MPKICLCQQKICFSGLLGNLRRKIGQNTVQPAPSLRLFCCVKKCVGATLLLLQLFLATDSLRGALAPAIHVFLSVLLVEFRFRVAYRAENLGRNLGWTSCLFGDSVLGVLRPMLELIESWSLAFRWFFGSWFWRVLRRKVLREECRFLRESWCLKWRIRPCVSFQRSFLGRC